MSENLLACTDNLFLFLSDTEDRIDVYFSLSTYQSNTFVKVSENFYLPIDKLRHPIFYLDLDKELKTCYYWGNLSFAKNLIKEALIGCKKALCELEGFF
ncbi:MAG: hypothetical protein HFJ53_07075 [Clostridia bacterium]|jgi:hypothetical protein|nr:hypothetical protein [Clostridia bacterium]